jgi:hypothetical protein
LKIEALQNLLGIGEIPDESSKGQGQLLDQGGSGDDLFLFQEGRLLIDVNHLEIIPAPEMFLTDPLNILDGANGNGCSASHIKSQDIDFFRTLVQALLKRIAPVPDHYFPFRVLAEVPGYTSTPHPLWEKSPTFFSGGRQPSQRVGPAKPDLPKSGSGFGETNYFDPVYALEVLLTGLKSRPLDFLFFRRINQGFLYGAPKL